MNFGRSFTYIFEDPMWTNKLVMITALSFASIIPIFGLLPLAALMGYLVELVGNMKARQPHPLPMWNNFERKLTTGGPVLLAIIVYNIPILFLFGCVWTSPGLVGGGDLGSMVLLSLLCCTFPLIILFSSVLWSLLAVSISRYAANPRANVLYEFGISWAAMTSNGGTVAQWLVYTLGVNVLLAICAPIVCIGWIVGAALAIPIHGYLLGQLAILTDPARSRR
jgi:hypothetical protein